MNKDPNIRQTLRAEVARVLRGASAPAVRNVSAGVGVVVSTATPSGLTTTDDLREGETRLYFTEARVYAAAKALLRAGANVTVTADDAAMTLTIAAAVTGNDAVSRRRSWMGL